MAYNVDDYFYGSVKSADLGFPVYETFMSPDGLHLFKIASSGGAIEQYSLSPAKDITSAAYVREVAYVNHAPRSFCFSPDGLKQYVMEYQYGSCDILEYTLTEAWNISTRSFIVSIVTQDEFCCAIRISDDGTQLYELSQSTSHFLYQSNLTVAGSIASVDATASISIVSIAGAEDSHLLGFTFADSEDSLYGIGSKDGFTEDYVYQFSLASTGDITSLSFVDDKATEADNAYSIFFDDTEEILYEVCDFIYQLDYKPTYFFDFVHSIELPTDHTFDFKHSLAPFKFHSFAFTQSVQQPSTIRFFNFVNEIEQPDAPLVIERVNT